MKQVKYPNPKDRPLICCAVANEIITELFSDPIIITGIGKVNASTALTKFLIDNPGNWHIINVGSCGALSIESNIGDIVYPTIFHDLDSAMPDFQYPDFKPSLIHSISPNPKEHSVIGTSDTFVEERSLATSYYDMESYSLIATARVFHLPFTAIKVVTDFVGLPSKTPWIKKAQALSGSLSQELLYYLTQFHPT